MKAVDPLAEYTHVRKPISLPSAHHGELVMSLKPFFRRFVLDFHTVFMNRKKNQPEMTGI